MDETTGRVNMAPKTAQPDFSKATLRISTDGLSVHVSLPAPVSADCSYTVENIRSFLEAGGITVGINDQYIQNILDRRLYGQPILVAEGIAPVNGEDGYFEYNFRTKIDNKPKILEDGSVDYRTVDIYEPVTEGAVIAKYTRATKGKEGMTVEGKVLKAMSGKELPPLKGTGFRISTDFHTYISEMNGKIEFNNGSVTISRVLDIKGDVDIATGDIVFDGDVVIHGAVLAGSIIKAGGDLTIMGNVESAYIRAGGSIQLKSGMQGGGKGTVECDGDVWGKFFEQSIIRVKGDLHANSIMNCDVYVEHDVYVSGRRGILVGGTTIAIGNIEATIVGNLSEVKTSLSVGVRDTMLAEIDSLRVKLVDIANNLTKLRQILDKVDGLPDVNDKVKLMSMRNQVMSTVNSLEEDKHVAEKQLEDKLELISMCSSSRIIVHKFIFPRVSVKINGIGFIVDDTYTNVYLKDSEGRVKVINEF